MGCFESKEAGAEAAQVLQDLRWGGIGEGGLQRSTPPASRVPSQAAAPAGKTGAGKPSAVAGKPTTSVLGKGLSVSAAGGGGGGARAARAGRWGGGARMPCPSPLLLLLHPLQDITEDYNLGKVLGRGQFGTTRLAENKRDKLNYACKSIAKRKLTCARGWGGTGACDGTAGPSVAAREHARAGSEARRAAASVAQST